MKSIKNKRHGKCKSFKKKMKLSFEEGKDNNNITCVSCMFIGSEREPKKFDIMSNLIRRNMHTIVRNIFWHLNEEDLSSAVVAGFHWSSALNSERWANKYFVDVRNTITLKTMFRREQLLRCNENSTPVQTSCQFRQACINYYQLRANCVKLDVGKFRVSLPLFFKQWKVYDIVLSHNLIVPALRKMKNDGSFAKKATILVYDRWTLQLLNISSLGENLRDVRLPSDYSKIIAFDIEHDQPPGRKAIFWNFATGRVRTCDSKPDGNVIVDFCHDSNLFVFTRPGERNLEVATVYKSNNNGELEILVENELLHSAIGCTFLVPGSESHDYIGLVVCRGSRVLQIRSKHDFALIRTIPLDKKIHYRHSESFLLLNDSFLLVKSQKRRVLEVRSLHDGGRTLVHRFATRDKQEFFWSKPLGYVIHGALLMAKSGFNVVLWLMPPNICLLYRSILEGGSVCTTLDCQVLVMLCGKGVGRCLTTHVDAFGIAQIELDQNDPADMSLSIPLVDPLCKSNF